MTRRGKIARLPRLRCTTARQALPIREQVNQPLENGEEGKKIVEWLNSQPEVTAQMTAEFDGQPVSAANLSNTIYPVEKGEERFRPRQPGPIWIPQTGS
jgi:hypothetical protein